MTWLLQEKDGRLGMGRERCFALNRVHEGGAGENRLPTCHAKRLEAIRMFSLVIHGQQGKADVSNIGVTQIALSQCAPTLCTE
jgi:hypothetical protein